MGRSQQRRECASSLLEKMVAVHACRVVPSNVSRCPASRALTAWRAEVSSCFNHVTRGEVFSGRRWWVHPPPGLPRSVSLRGGGDLAWQAGMRFLVQYRGPPADDLSVDDARLISRLLKQAELLTAGARAKTIHIRAGALSNVSPAVLERQFRQATIGGALDGATLEFDIGHDPLALDALQVVVTRVELSE